MMPRRVRARLLLGLVSIAQAHGCECEGPRSREPVGSAPATLAIAAPPARLRRARFDAGPDEPAAPAVSSPRSARTKSGRLDVDAPVAVVDATEARGSVLGPFVLDGLIDVGPAGPATATERGIVMVDRDNQLFVARLQHALDSGAVPRPTPLLPLPESAGPFPLAHGPAIRRGMAYWVSQGRLLRQALTAAGTPAPPVVLAEDARAGTRVAVAAGDDFDGLGMPPLAAYIARPTGPDQPSTAKLWIEGAATPLSLTDDTASAHSVALVASAEGYSAMFLEARTGMSSIHLRGVHVARNGVASLEQDRVVWVGGPSRPSTELLVHPGAAGPLALMTVERDMTHFGLVLLPIVLAPGAAPLEPEWLLYANGIEPAPFATTSVCGRSVVVLARPSSAVPHAPQELVLIELGGGDTQKPVLIARSKAFFDVSIAVVGKGALLTYVADHRTWARSLRCTVG